MELPYIERTVVIREQGSLEFTAEELAADIVLVDVLCTAFSRVSYTSLKTLPPNGYYGAVTLFAGATVKETIPLEYPYQRVLDFEQTFRRTYCYLTLLERKLARIEAVLDAPDNVPPAEPAELPQSFVYRGLPYSKVKVKSTVAAQWNVTVRRYLQVTDFNCQSVSQSEDPTKGEDEDPTPLPIPNPDFYPPTLPPPSPAYPGADPDDFPEGTPIPLVRRRVEFGWRGLASGGLEGFPDNCIFDIPISEIFVWEDAGPTPYTAELAAEVASCTNLRQGIRIRDGEGRYSPTQATGAGFGSVELITFTLL